MCFDFSLKLAKTWSVGVPPITMWHNRAKCMSWMNRVAVGVDTQVLKWSILVSLQLTTDDLALLSIFVSVNTVDVFDFQKRHFTAPSG